MIRSDRQRALKTWQRAGALAHAAAGLALLIPLVAHAQSFSQGAQGQPPAEAAPPARPQEPGVFESIGRFFDQGAASFREHIGRAKERVDDFNDKAAATGKDAVEVTRGAVDAVVKLPAARVVQGRQVCHPAANGAPDCGAAADRLCKEKGFGTGKSMDFTSAEKCPPRVWASGRQGNEAACTTETFISRAMCQ
jgi:hypothetical protein